MVESSALKAPTSSRAQAQWAKLLHVAGKKDEAMAAVPKELIDACHLVGPAERIKERLGRWKEAGSKGHVSDMLLGCQQPEALELIAGEIL